MVRVRAIWRHPIKGHGHEQIDAVSLIKGQTMPWDRHWAVAHEATKSDGTAWSHCANYSRCAKSASLMAISAQLDESAGTLTLSHPDRPELRFNPDTQAEAFLDWVRPLMPSNRAQPTHFHHVPRRGMTDTDYASISLINLASNTALSSEMDITLSPLRWRANILLEGLPAWSEFDLCGKTLRIGEAELEVTEPIERCKATQANPETGKYDADTLAALQNGHNHQNFGIFAVVTRAGRIQAGDALDVL